jgi:fatty acid desaturase (delta-4 desaturase)
MPPDADKLRQRRTTQVQVGNSSLTNDTTVTTTTRTIASIDDLSSTEICIDGKVYDISTFDHPGGESIGIFGGNDVTVQYKMIHPYHSSKHLEKITLVGKINDYHSE